VESRKNLGGKLGAAMSEKQLKDFLESLKRVREENNTPEKSLKFLVEAGIYAEAGELTEPYRPIEPEAAEVQN
jgi:hypothetical protein